MASVNQAAFRFIMESNPQVIDGLVAKIKTLEGTLQVANQRFAAGAISADQYENSIVRTSNKIGGLQGKIRAAKGAWNLNTEAVRQGTFAFQDFMSTSGDLGQKLNSVTNNLQQVLMGFGKWGPYLTVAVIAAVELYKNWDNLNKLFATTHAIPESADQMKNLEGKIKDVNKQLDDMREKGKLTTAELQEYKKLSAELAVLEEKKAKAMERQDAIKAAAENKFTADEKKRRGEIGEEFTEITAGKDQEIEQNLALDAYQKRVAKLGPQAKLIRSQMRGTKEEIEQKEKEGRFTDDLKDKLKDLQKKVDSVEKEMGKGITEEDKGDAAILMGKGREGDLEAIKEIRSRLPKSPLREKLDRVETTKYDVEKDDKENERRGEARKKREEEAQKKREEEERITEEIEKGLDKADEDAVKQQAKENSVEEKYRKQLQPISNTFLAQIDALKQTDKVGASNLQKKYDKTINRLLVGTDAKPSDLRKEVGGARIDDVAASVKEKLSDQFSWDLHDAKEPAVKQFGKQQGNEAALMQVISVAQDQINQTKELQQMISELQGGNRETKQGNRALKSQMNR